MSVFDRFYSKAEPLINNFCRKHHRDLPIHTQGAIKRLLFEAIGLCEAIYKKDILKQKYNLNIDLSNQKIPEDDKPLYIKKFQPCEICGNTRISHLCHIIPRKEGGSGNLGNILSLCANHHYLFDQCKLTKEEWDQISWDIKHPDSTEYALTVMHKRHEMYWRYNYPGIVGCGCGSQEFGIRYTEKNSKTREGGIEVVPGQVIKHLKCKKCGERYTDVIYKGVEYYWWQDWVHKRQKP